MGLGAAPDTPSLGSNSQFNRDLANKAFLPNADDFIKTLVFNIWGGIEQQFQTRYWCGNSTLIIRSPPQKGWINTGRFEKPLLNPAWRLNPSYLHSHVETEGNMVC